MVTSQNLDMLPKIFRYEQPRDFPTNHMSQGVSPSGPPLSPIRLRRHIPTSAFLVPEATSLKWSKPQRNLDGPTHDSPLPLRLSSPMTTHYPVSYSVGSLKRLTSSIPLQLAAYMYIQLRAPYAGQKHARQQRHLDSPGKRAMTSQSTPVSEEKQVPARSCSAARPWALLLPLSLGVIGILSMLS